MGNEKITKKILLAINSTTILNVLAQEIKNYGEESDSPYFYDVVTAEDGQQAMDKVFSERPDLVISYTDLPVLNGYTICRVIKYTDFLKNLPVVLCSNDDAGYYFWIKNSRCDGFFIISPDNYERLKTMIPELLGKYENANKFPVIDSQKNVIDLATKAYDKELFELYMLKTAYERGDLMFDIFELIEKTASDLSHIYKYDAIAIILNSREIIEYYDRESHVSENDFEDFKKVCHADFEARFAGRNDYNWDRSILRENKIEGFDDVYSKLKCYRVFPSKPIQYPPVIIQIASCSENDFSEELTQRLDIFTKIYSDIIGKAILYRNAVIAENRMHNLFTQYLPAKIIEDKLSGKNDVSAVHGVQKKVAILIANIRNFTSITENLEPKIVVDFLNTYFSRLGKIIEKNGGTIDKYMGDALMALFGATDDSDNNGYKAAVAAMEIQKEIDNFEDEILDKLELPPEYKFKIGIAIHYGKPIVGEIGSEARKDYTVIGDDVNLVSRIESLNKIFGIQTIISEEVKKDIDEVNKKLISIRQEKDSRLLTRSLGKIRVRGKEKITRIFELYSEKEKYSEEYLNLYRKGLHQYMLGSLESSLRYFEEARQIRADLDTEFMIERVQEQTDDFERHPEYLEKWDGSITIITK